jgi:hypothetical protein
VVKGSATKILEEAQNAADSLEAMIPHLNAVGTSATELLDLSESLRDKLVDNPSWTYDAVVSLVDLAEARRLVRKEYDELRAAENVNSQTIRSDRSRWQQNWLLAALSPRSIFAATVSPTPPSIPDWSISLYITLTSAIMLSTTSNKG